MENESEDNNHIGLNYIDTQSLLGLIASHGVSHNIQISDLIKTLNAGNIKISDQSLYNWKAYYEEHGYVPKKNTKKHLEIIVIRRATTNFIRFYYLHEHKKKTSNLSITYQSVL